MISIRAAAESDAAAIREVTTAAFDDPLVANLVDRLATDAARASLVAVEDDAVVGHTMLSRGWIDADRELVETLVLSPLSVRPDRQGRGIGGDLVRAALGEAESLGATAVFLEGSARYYPRFGFGPATAHGFTAPSPRIPEPAFQVVVLPAWQSWMTGALVYPDAFWALDCVGLRGERLRAVLAQLGN